MIIALHYCRKDQHLALALAEWLASIGTYPNHDFLIFRDQRAANASFGGLDARSVNEVVITDDIANSWPASANHAFKKIAKHVQYACKGVPFLLLEPDAVVLRASAFDEVEAEYQQALAEKKFFLGDLIDHRRQLPGSVLHMSGIGVFPGNMTQYAGEVFYADDKTPWDIAAGPAIHSQAKQSELIFHVWNQQSQGLSPFKDWSDVEAKIFARRPKCAIFHSDKTGSLLALLRERKNFSGGTENTGLVPSNPSTDAARTTAALTSMPGSESSDSPAENNSGKEGDAPCGIKKQVDLPPSSAEPTSQPESSAEKSLTIYESPDPAIPDCNKLWVRVDAAGRYIETLEWKDGQWSPATWPQETADYKLRFTIANQQTPWAEKHASVDEIKALALRLRQFQTDMAKTRMVREYLHDAGVIKLPYRFGKRKGWKRRKK